MVGTVLVLGAGVGGGEQWWRAGREHAGDCAARPDLPGLADTQECGQHSGPLGSTFSGVTFCPLIPLPCAAALVPGDLVVYVACPRREGVSPSPSSSLSLGLVDEVHPLGPGSPDLSWEPEGKAGLWHQAGLCSHPISAIREVGDLWQGTPCL